MTDAAPAGRLFSYARVSTVEQATDRSSLDDQERRIAGVALMRGAAVAECFRDPGVSGSVMLTRRPGGKALLAALKPGDLAVVAKLDRLFRSAQDALVTVEVLRKRGVGLVIADMGADPVTENGVSKLFFTMLAAFAEFERGRIAERVADGRRSKRAAGGFIGGEAPFGWRVAGSGRTAALEPDPEEQAVVAHARMLRESGLTLRGVAEVLSDRGEVSRSGRPLSVTQVHRMLDPGRGPPAPERQPAAHACT